MPPRYGAVVTDPLERLWENPLVDNIEKRGDNLLVHTTETRIEFRPFMGMSASHTALTYFAALDGMASGLIQQALAKYKKPRSLTAAGLPDPFA